MTIEEFAAKIERETRMKYEKFFTDTTHKEELVRGASQVKIIPGKKYTKVDVGRSGKYMIVNDTGEIFGIKGYGVIHRGHRYGTLDTVTDYYWGEYVAVKTRRVNP